jgi:hypothetical protein
MLARQKRHQLRTDVDGEEPEKVALLGGHSRVVSVMRVRCVKNSGGLRTDSKYHCQEEATRLFKNHECPQMRNAKR